MVSNEEMQERDCDHKWILVKSIGDDVYLYCEKCGKYIKKRLED